MDIDIGTARLSAIDEGDFVGVQIDGLGDKPGLPPYELYAPYGLMHRPADPDSDGRGCTAFYGNQGRDKFAWLGHDPRVQKKLPNLKAGETGLHGYNGQFVRLHNDGSISLCTNTNAEDQTAGHSIFLRISPTKGLEFESPWGFFRFGPNGLQIQHSSGAKWSLGSIGGIPAPLNALASYVKASAAIISLDASAVSQGTDAGATHAAAVTALTALLTALAAIIDAKNPQNPAASTAVAAAIPAITQLGAIY